MTKTRKALNGFINLLRTKTARQTGILYGSKILGMALGFVTTIIVTRSLGPTQYGVLVFILSVITFSSLFFEFGFFSAGARLLAISRSLSENSN